MRGVGFLVVDDDVGVANTVGRVLGNFAPAEVVTTTREAFAAVAKLRLGIVVDVEMPGASGLDILRHGRVANPHTPAMILTAHDWPAIFSTAVELNANYVPKPAEYDTLVKFATRSLAQIVNGTSAVEAVLKRWTTEHGLRPSETDILRCAASGLDRDEIAKLRGVSVATVHTQINRLLEATHDVKLCHAAGRILREALAISSVQPR